MIMSIPEPSLLFHSLPPLTTSSQANLFLEGFLHISRHVLQITSGQALRLLSHYLLPTYQFITPSDVERSLVAMCIPSLCY